MEIVYLGHSCFEISSKQSTVITDPFDPKIVGIKFPKIEKADIVTVSHQHPDHNFLTEIPPGAFKITGPGEYEVGGTFVKGLACFHDDKRGGERGSNTIYTITMDDVVVCHLGDLGHKLSDEILDRIGTVDILLVPVGGFYTITADVASEVVVQLEPRIVIPMHFKQSLRFSLPAAGLNTSVYEESFGKLDGVDVFLKKMGVEGATALPKIVTSKEKLPETTTVIVLE